jgi:hypothetical protein
VVTSEPLAVFSRFGPGAGGARVRVFDWLRETGVPVSVFCFESAPRRVGPAGLLLHPVRAFSSHLRSASAVRRLCAARAFVYSGVSPLSAGRLEERLATSTQLIVDLDDALFFDDSTSFRRHFIAEKCRRMVMRADRVVAGNAYIADWATKYCKDVRIVPSCVRISDYLPKAHFDVASTPRAVWIGSPSTEQYLSGWAEPLLRHHRKSGLRLVVISSGSASLGPLDAMLDRVEWDPTSTTKLGEYDFGIMPLKDGRFERGKCGYKLLQYGASCLPTIANPVGVNEALLSGFGALAPRSPDDVEAAIDQLLGWSAFRRAEVGHRSRLFVEAGFSYSSRQSDWEDAVCN